jgi:hypothetical protein
MKITNRSPILRPIADAVPPIKEDSHDTCLAFFKATIGVGKEGGKN